MPDTRPLFLCLTCGRPSGDGAAGDTWRCACDADVEQWRRSRSPDPERPIPWNLCVLCARDYAPLRSRWSWLACPSCQAVNRQVGDTWGRDLALPLGRHSIMNGSCLRLSETDVDRIRTGLGSLAMAPRNWQRLHEWFEAEWQRVLGALPEQVRAAGRVPVQQYPALAGAGPAASEDAWLRCWGIRSLADLAAVRQAVDEVFGPRG